MITHEELELAAGKMLSTGNAKPVIDLFEQQGKQYQELVDAAVAWHERVATTYNYDEHVALVKAIKPFLPSPSIADELDALADEAHARNSHLLLLSEDQLRELAGRYRELHGEGRDE